MIVMSLETVMSPRFVLIDMSYDRDCDVTEFCYYLHMIKTVTSPSFVMIEMLHDRDCHVTKVCYDCHVT